MTSTQLRGFSVSVMLFMASQVSAQTVVTGIVMVTTRAGIPAQPVVVYALPIDRPVADRAATLTLSQRNKAFAPSVLGVPVGSTIEFPNQDAIFHNVFSLSSPAPFDLGLYRAGASRSKVFAEAGTYRVFCNIHPQMSAVIVVVPTPFVTVTDRDGAYTLTLPTGRYRVTATTGRGAAMTKDVAVTGAAATIERLELDERALVEAPHTNKFGKPYAKAAYER